MKNNAKPVGRPIKDKNFDTKQEVRCFDYDKNLIKKAAGLASVSASELWRKAALKEAKRLIKKHEKIGH